MADRLDRFSLEELAGHEAVNPEVRTSQLDGSSGASARTMSFRRTMASSVGVQAIGPACALATVVVIARAGGPVEQGQYAQFRAWVDLAVTLGCFGFPQGFVYVVNRLNASAAALGTWSVLYSLAFIPVALAGFVLALWLGLLGNAAAAPYETVFVLTLAAAILVLHGLWRGVYLTHDAGIRFGIFTILPAATLLSALAFAMLSGWRRYDWVILASTLPTALVACVLMRPILRGAGERRYRDLPWGPLLSNGLHTFVQAMMLVLQPVAVYGVVRLQGGGSREIGLLNVGMLLVQGLSVPVNMTAPLLFARWTAVRDDKLMERLHGLTWRLVGLGALVGAGLALAAGPVVPLAFGSEYAGSVPAVQAMMLTLPLLCHIRFVAPALHSRGQPMVNTVALTLRLVACSVLGMVLSIATGNVLLGIGMGWALAEIAAAACTFLGLRYMHRAVLLRA